MLSMEAADKKSPVKSSGLTRGDGAAVPQKKKQKKTEDGVPLVVAVVACPVSAGTSAAALQLASAID